MKLLTKEHLKCLFEVLNNIDYPVISDEDQAIMDANKDVFDAIQDIDKSFMPINPGRILSISVEKNERI